MNSSMMVRANENHILKIVFSAAAEPLDVMSMAQGVLVFLARLSDADLSASIVQTLQFFH